jgi:hypothetical protein
LSFAATRCQGAVVVEVRSTMSCTACVYSFTLARYL